MKFKVGDLVLCIQSKHEWHTSAEPETGKLYIVYNRIMEDNTFAVEPGFWFHSSCFVYPNLTKLEKLIYGVTD